MERRWVQRIYFLTCSGIILWLGVIFLAPYLKSKSNPFGILIFYIFEPLCHQIESRCFYLWGKALPVCTRCLGIYTGFLFGAGFFPLFRGFSMLQIPRAKTFFVFSAPIVIDFVGNFLNIWASGAWLRFAVGLLWGSILPYYFITGAADFFIHQSRRS